MDATTEIFRIIAPWTVKRKAVLNTDVSFVDKKDIIKLRNHAYEMRGLSTWYAPLCSAGQYHQELRGLLRAPDYFSVFVKSSDDWGRLDYLFTEVVDVSLRQSALWLAKGRDILELVDKMDLMEQLDCTIGDLTEDKLNELRSRSLSQHDVQAVGALSEILTQVLKTVMGNQVLVMTVKLMADSFSRDCMVMVSPALNRLYKATGKQTCRTEPCFTYMLYADAILNNVVNYAVVDGPAAAVNDLSVVLSTYLKSTTSELAGMHDNLAVLFFAVQLQSVVEAWQTVDALLLNTKKALQ
ncbi:hypothetical protein [Pseudomonas putida]